MRLIDADALETALNFACQWSNDTFNHGVNKGLRDAIAILRSMPEADPITIDAKFEVLYELSCANYGKQCYSKEDGSKYVYSRYSCKHMTIDEAIEEFKEMIQCD